MAKKTKKKPKGSIVNVNHHSSNFKFNSNTTVGTAEAANDRYLSETYFDNGTLEMILATNSPKSLIVGRTGAGKTALVERLIDQEQYVINIDPEHLSLGYLVDSTLLRFFYDSGIKMDLFYKLLWNHIFIVEILKAKYNITSEVSRSNLISRFFNYVSGNRAKNEAVEYLFEWNDKFWLGTEARVKEVVDKFEKQVYESVSADAKVAIPSLVDISARAEKREDGKVSEEVKSEIITRGRDVVSRIQTQRIIELLKLLNDEILTDRQKPFYITIDRLDEDWVNDELRYHLIKSLIEVARDLNTKLENLKISVALRQDLISRVFMQTQDSGFQEEKFQDLYVNLYWSPKELQNLIEIRLKKILDDSGDSKKSDIYSLLPKVISNEKPMDYMIARTMLRPRDLILFFNAAIENAAGKSSISATDITSAEINYSQSRLNALQHEWGKDYPNIKDLIGFLRKYPPSFTMEEVDKRFRESALDFLTRTSTKTDVLHEIISEYYGDNKSMILLEKCFEILYKVGAIGVKSTGRSEVYWSFKSRFNTPPPFSEKSIYFIHPCLWSALSIRPSTVKHGVLD